MAAATATLSAKPTSEWFEGASFLHCCALMGVLVKSGEPEASKVVDDAVAGLAPLLADHRVFDPIEIADRVRVAMGAPPAAKTKPRTNPAIDFAVAQGFSVANKPGWYAKIWMAKGEPNEWFGAMQEETQLFLKIDSKHKPYWKLELQPANSRQRYANWSGKVTQDDFGLPPLTRLEDFPGWLGAAGKKMKTSFEPATAKISTGRHRKLGGELRKWLAGS